MRELTELRRRAAEPGLVPPAPAPRGWPRVGAAELGRRARQLLRDRSRAVRRGAADARAARSTPPATRSAPTDVRRRARRAVARGCCSCAPATARGPRSPRRSLEEHVSGTGRSRQRGQPSQAAASERRARDAQARHRHQRNRTKHLDEFARSAVRHGDHALRPRPRGVPRVSFAARARALERARPGARRSDRTARPTRRSSAPPPSSRPRIGFLLQIMALHPSKRRSTHAQR